MHLELCSSLRCTRQALQASPAHCIAQPIAPGKQPLLNGCAVQNMKRGSLNTVQEQVQRAQRSLGAAHFADIDAKFRTQQIELHTTELATSDLDKYHKVRASTLARSGCLGAGHNVGLQGLAQHSPSCHALGAATQ